MLLVSLVVIALRNASSKTTTDSVETLTQICRGDQAKVEGLIAGEQTRNSALNEEQAAQAAIHAFRRDNR